MHLSILSDSDALSHLSDFLTVDPSSTEGIAELLRAEVSARGQCARHLTITRVCRLAAPAVALDPTRVDDVCDELERDGDLALASGNILFASPVRLVDLSHGVFRFVAALPIRALRGAVPGEWTLDGTLRECKLPGGLTMPSLAAKLGAVLLSTDACRTSQRRGGQAALCMRNC